MLVHGQASQRFPDRARVLHELAEDTEVRKSPAAPDQQSEVRATGLRHAFAQQRVHCRECNPVVDMVEGGGRQSHSGEDFGGVHAELAKEGRNFDQSACPLATGFVGF
jgi:hypothetical protein